MTALNTAVCNKELSKSTRVVSDARQRSIYAVPSEYNNLFYCEQIGNYKAKGCMLCAACEEHLTSIFQATKRICRWKEPEYKVWRKGENVKQLLRGFRYPANGEGLQERCSDNQLKEPIK